jgi:predicted glycoside hydrolase/deacetylase ChbG (UPF0249 family)
MTHTNTLLGYPDDARLLILNADDFGMYDAINAAILQTLAEGMVGSTSLMVPCPAAPQAMNLLRANPQIDFAVHLTLVRDLPNYQYAPLTSAPSLTDENGSFYIDQDWNKVKSQVRLDDVEAEFRAQIETVLNNGLQPTHLDWHCLGNGGRPDIFDLTLALAKEYRLALRVSPPYVEQVQSQGLPCVDYDLLDSFRVPTAEKPARYIQMLRDLPVGLTEWAVHPGLNTAEAQALDDGWPVRWADYKAFTSPEVHETIEKEGIILIRYRALQEAWQNLSN